jgi:hypothetical protein
MKETEEIYVSIDIEADGKVPGLSSMINFGAAFYFNNGDFIDSYEANLSPLPPPASPNPETTQWWEQQFAKNPKLKDFLNFNVRPARVVMPDFLKFSESVGALYKKPMTVIAYPAGFDWTWMYWYLIRFTGKSPFGFSCLDIKSYAAAKMNCDYRHAVKRNMPKDWFDKKLKHNHTGLADCQEQASLFFSMRNA